ncbi:MAG TPA: biotin carboxylase N-terminal domain-containing protein, partial [Burkholderiaceae bacterium]|nr:biotin carboxylase N-terminal domain-containing protein [Burkholderiaceae bacterium]
MFNKVLIANRGEIAIRIARAAAALGVDTVGVHAPIDALSLHTKMVGRAVELPAGGGDPVRAYLDIEAIVAAAVDTGCDAVHPGYGFLSENAAFARRCAEAGVRFIGPEPESLALFGDKVRARAFARELKIPVIAGASAPLASVEQAREVAATVGYPVMLKAAAGGGGRGMRAVARPEEMAEAFARCQGEAEAAFGDRAVFLEKRVTRPRHIEVQVFGDHHGNVIHLRERDCSVQLRNQKVVEIAPAPNLAAAVRERILDDALKLARAAKYRNAGTVEFLVDPQSGEHFFIECNPRIQVEHTITEQVMGVDLVELQFRIAAGESLASLGLGEQQQVGEPRGYAIQARVVATGTGVLSAYREPSGPGVRVDGCGYLGLAPPPQFDPLLAKLIVQSNSSRTYESAVDHTLRAPDEFHIAGVPTNAAQLRAILEHPAVRAGDARTTLLAEVPGLADGRPVAASIDAGSAPGAAGIALSFLDQQAAALGRAGGPGVRRPGAAAAPSLPVPDGELAVE